MNIKQILETCAKRIASVSLKDEAPYHLIRELALIVQRLQMDSPAGLLAALGDM